MRNLWYGKLRARHITFSICIFRHVLSAALLRACPRSAADTNFDASVPTFGEDYLSSGVQRPDWVVTSPPYKGAIQFVKAALAVATKGVALKLPLSFMEPCGDRGVWLQTNTPSVCIFLRRVTYTPAHVTVGEFWGVWYKSAARDVPTRLVYCP